MPRPSSERNTARSMMLPMTRARKITKVLTTPCTSVRVTMRRWRTVRHFMAEHRLDLLAAHALQSPLLTATSAALRAGAGGEGVRSGESKIPTSGMATPTARA